MTKTALEAVGDLLTDIVGPAFEEAAKDEWATEFVADLSAAGFVIRPKEPTKESIEAAALQIMRGSGHTISLDDARVIAHAALIAAAETQP